MKILIAGSGGREHALGTTIEKSPLVDEVIYAPGNGGVDPAKRRNLKADDLSGILALMEREQIDGVLFGPEMPLILGGVDFIEANGKWAFGPRMRAVRLERSKVFAKHFCERHGIPTPAYRVTSLIREAERIIKGWGELPVVVKANGPAAGKGVVIAHTVDEALEAARDCLERSVFGESGKLILIERFKEGKEASFIIITDSVDYQVFPLARDYKRARDGDQGLNTGGAGVVSTDGLVSAREYNEVLGRIVEPTLRGARKDDMPYQGFLYVQVMLTADGPFLIEYNCRFGDPEAQAVLTRIESDIVPLLLASRTLGGLRKLPLMKVSADSTVCVVSMAEGYPGKVVTDRPVIIGKLPKGVTLFHAGTERASDGTLVNVGGRVLNLIGKAPTVRRAAELALQGLAQTHLHGQHFRTDIGRGL